MTIRRGGSWGRAARRDPLVPEASTDEEMHRMFEAGVSTIVLTGGDLARALGAVMHRPSAISRMMTFPVDAYDVTWTDHDGAPRGMRCYSHCVHGSWWRGESRWFSSGGFIDGRELLPRSHPNDGLVDVMHISAAMNVRQRVVARRRLRWGSHLPHPDLQVHRATAVTWHVDRPARLIIDGTVVGRAADVTVTVIPDAHEVSIVVGDELPGS